MSVSITWLGHSAFQLDIDGHPVLFDPFLTGNPLASTTADALDAEIILVSHAHGDHVGDTVSIAKRTGAKVISNAEIVKWLGENGVTNTHPQNTGGSFDHGFIKVKQTIAFHSSSFPDGMYGGDPNGFIITMPDGLRIYYAGDTALFSDMRLIGDEHIDIAFLPIGDNFTMGPEDALKAVRYIQPKLVIPMHYNTWPLIAVDVAGWANEINRKTNATPIVLDPGGSYTVED